MHTRISWAWVCVRTDCEVSVMLTALSVVSHVQVGGTLTADATASDDPTELLETLRQVILSEEPAVCWAPSVTFRDPEAPAELPSAQNQLERRRLRKAAVQTAFLLLQGKEKVEDHNNSLQTKLKSANVVCVFRTHRRILEAWFTTFSAARRCRSEARRGFYPHYSHGWYVFVYLIYVSNLLPRVNTYMLICFWQILAENWPGSCAMLFPTSQGPPPELNLVEFLSEHVLSHYQLVREPGARWSYPPYECVAFRLAVKVLPHIT
jgi:hypothetical protein